MHQYKCYTICLAVESYLCSVITAETGLDWVGHTVKPERVHGLDELCYRDRYTETNANFVLTTSHIEGMQV